MNDPFKVDPGLSLDHITVFDGLPDVHLEHFTSTQERNARRASFAVTALQAYERRVAPSGGEPIDTLLGDLMCDLMHFCDLFGDGHGPDILQGILDDQQIHYAEEVGGE